MVICVRANPNQGQHQCQLYSGKTMFCPFFSKWLYIVYFFINSYLSHKQCLSKYSQKVTVTLSKAKDGLNLLGKRVLFRITLFWSP